MEFDQAFEPFLHHIFWNLVFHGGSRRTGADRVLERVRLRKPGLAHHVHGLFEVFLGFTRESNNDVGGDRRVRDTFAYLVQNVHEAFGAVGPAHGFQHGVRP